MLPVIDLFDFIPSGDTLSKSLLYLIGSALLAFIIAPFIINFLYKFDITRKSKGDKLSYIDEKEGKIGTPIMGGIIGILSIIIITFTFNLERNYTLLPIGVFVLSALVGGLDDILNLFGQKRIPPKGINKIVKLARVHKSLVKRVILIISLPNAYLKQITFRVGSLPNSGLLVHEKLILQALIGLTVGFWLYFKLDWTTIWIPFISNSNSNLINLINSIPYLTYDEVLNRIDVGILIVPFVTLVIMTITNAVNISDGMDGLSAGMLLIAFISYGIIAYSFSQIPNSYNYRYLTYLNFTVAGSLLAYLYYNIKPARVQFGDIGSLSFGTLLATIAIVLNREFTLLFIAGAMLYNGIFSIILQRFFQKFFKRKLFYYVPFHYHLKQKGWSEEKIVMRFWIITFFLSVVGVWIAGY